MQNYQVLARKYRPQNFSQVVGQEHVLTAIENGLQTNRLHHAYLFAGTRGVGKTSIARLFAKGLNCLNGVTADPCGKCANCVAIEEGRFVDLIEIDAASRTKVEDTRELLENVQYRPTNARFKVYLIDEVHMLSRHSFNALLKTLEEPPEYVKFLLATTDPQKLPVTILSRCMQFNLKALQPSQISQNLHNILQKEQIPFEPQALDSIAQSAQGSIRDSLSLADQAIALGSGKITFQCVKDMLGILDSDQSINILVALQQANGESLMHNLFAIAEKGGNWIGLVDDLLHQLHRIAMLQFLPNTEANNDQLVFLAQHIAPQDVQFFYQIIQQGRKDLDLSHNLRESVEMLLLRALAFHPKFSGIDFSAEEITKTNASSLNVNPPSPAKPTPLTPPAPPKAVTIDVKKEDNEPNDAPSSVMETLVALQTMQEMVAEKKNNSVSNLMEKPEEKISPEFGGDKDLPPPNSPEIFHNVEPEEKKSSSAKSSTVKPKPETSHSPDIAEISSVSEDKIEQTDEEYSWQWINPELFAEQATTNLSQIKQILSNKLTPQLRTRIMEIAQEQDEWTKIVAEIGIKDFIKDMALGAVLLAKTQDEIKLGLRSNKLHLQKKYASQLQKALSDYYQQPIKLDITVLDSDEQSTPSELYERIYQQLCAESLQSLENDKKLAMLQKEFEGEIVRESVRPI